MSNDRGGFEEGWRKAFENAEISPPSSSWEKINDRITKKESKRIIPFYRYSIAASVLLAISVGLYFGVAEFNNQKSGESTQMVENSTEDHDSGSGDNIIQNENQTKDEKLALATESQENSTGNEISAQIDNNESFIERTDKNISQESGLSDGNISQKSKTEDLSEKEPLIAENRSSNELESKASKQQSLEHGDAISENPTFSQLASNQQLSYSIINLDHAQNRSLQEPQLALESVEIPGVENYSYGYELIGKETKQKDETIFLTGLNFSAGVFSQNSGSLTNAESNTSPLFDQSPGSQLRVMSPNLSSGNNFNSAQNYDLQLSEEFAQSTAFSYGANFGVKVAKRFVLFSGLNYTKAFSNVNSELGITRNGIVLANSFYSLESGYYDGSAEIRNEYEFLSVPVKAGYEIIDRKFNLTFFTGVSSEFLLENSISATGENIENAPLDRVNDVYNNMYLNGTLSINAGYTFLEKYRIYVEPIYKRAITDFIKDDFNEDRTPSFKMMMFGLSYQFH